MQRSPAQPQPHLNYTSSAHPTSCIGGKDASSSFLLQSPMRDTRGWNVDCGSRMCSSKAAGALFYIFPSVSSANIASGCFLPARNKRSWVACTLFWSRLRSHQLTQRQKGWQPVRIPGASLLHPVSVCWTKRWHEALADSAHQFSTHFFHLGRKQISWPWFHSRETCRMLIIGHRRVPLLRLSSLHSLCPLARRYLCHKAKANCDAQGKHCSVCP